MLVILNTSTAKGKKIDYPAPFANKLIKLGLAEKVVVKAPKKAKK